MEKLITLVFPESEKAKGSYTTSKRDDVERLGREGLTSAQIQATLQIERATWRIWTARYKTFAAAAKHARLNDLRADQQAKREKRARFTVKQAKYLARLIGLSGEQTQGHQPTVTVTFKDYRR